MLAEKHRHETPLPAPSVISTCVARAGDGWTVKVRWTDGDTTDWGRWKRPEPAQVFMAEALGALTGVEQEPAPAPERPKWWKDKRFWVMIVILKLTPGVWILIDHFT